jgi:hypothetical protein
MKDIFDLQKLELREHTYSQKNEVRITFSSEVEKTDKAEIILACLR